MIYQLKKLESYADRWKAACGFLERQVWYEGKCKLFQFLTSSVTSVLTQGIYPAILQLVTALSLEKGRLDFWSKKFRLDLERLDPADPDRSHYFKNVSKVFPADFRLGDSNTSFDSEVTFHNWRSVDWEREATAVCYEKNYSTMPKKQYLLLFPHRQFIWIPMSEL